MKQKSVLLYLPELPFSADALLPQRNLALAAQALARDDFAHEIWDLGTVEALAEAAGRCAAASVRPRRTRWWPGKSPLMCARQERRSQLLGRLAAADPDSLFLFVQNSRDYQEALRFSELARKLLPDMVQFLAGDYVSQFNAFLVHSGTWDAVLTTGAECILPEMLQRWRAGREILEHACVLSRSRRQSTAGESPGSMQTPLPAYDAGGYPGLNAQNKFLLFSIPHHDWGKIRNNYSPSRWPVVTRAVWRHRLDEIGQLQRTLGARIFHLTGGFGFDDIALGFPESFRELRQVEFAVELQMESLFTEMAPVLRRHGCRVASVRLDSGSQRLLEDFYGRSFGVSSAERRLSALADAGIFTIGHFQYPCAEDDYHTHAETLRFATRSRLSSALLSAPQVAPGSVWRQRPAEFGFLLPGLPFPHRRAGGDDLSNVRGYTASRSAAARQSLAGDLERFGVGGPCPAPVALLAQVSQQGRAEQAYAARLDAALQAMDVEAVAELVRIFNEQAVLPRESLMDEERSRIRAAVGN